MSEQLTLFTSEDKPILDLFDLADDASVVNSVHKTDDVVSNFATWRKDFSKLVGRVKYRSTETAMRLAPAAIQHSVRASDITDHTFPRRDTPIGIFLDTNVTGDEDRVKEHIRKVASYTKEISPKAFKVSYLSVFLGDLSVSAIQSVIAEASIYDITLIGKGVTSEMPYDDFKVRNNGLELLDGMVSLFEQAQDAGLRHAMVAHDVAQALKESGIIDSSFSLTCTGIAIDKERKTRHRVLATPAEGLSFANRIIVGSEVTQSPLPLEVLSLYIENIKASGVIIS